jgi:hypothetical protein
MSVRDFPPGACGELIGLFERREAEWYLLENILRTSATEGIGPNVGYHVPAVWDSLPGSLFMLFVTSVSIRST